LNVTAKEFAPPALINDVSQALKQTGFEASSLQLEIVETVAMGEGKFLAEPLAAFSYGYIEDRSRFHIPHRY
jgi:EAL domain-containing protein (putative c-di-GMP-specific phosphodiesterase class I)